jgi:uncharacterized protein YbaP (TraB family)
MKRIVLLLLSFALALGTATAQTTGKPAPTKHPFLWRIEGKGVEVQSFLFGTMHLGDDRLLAMPPVVEEARDNADALYCELALDQMAKHQLKLTKLMLLPKGQKLSKILPEDVAGMLDKKLKTLGASLQRFDHFKIWAISILLAQLEASKLGMLKSLDSMLYMDAKRDDKEVGGLEDVDEQMKAIGTGTEDEQIARLREALKYMAKLEAKGESYLKNMLEIYLTGNELKLQNHVDEAMGDNDELNDKFMKPLLDDRNERMVNRISKMLTSNPTKKYFFAVGAMHFVGRSAMTTLLRKKGYRITRVAPPPASWEVLVKIRTELTELRKEVRRLKKELEAAKKK